MIGRLQTDLATTDVPIYNGVAIRVQLGVQKDSFLILTTETSPKFKLKLEQVFLHVPVGILAPSVYSSIEHRLQSEDIVVHYKRSSVLVHDINKGVLEYRTSNLFLK